MKISAPNDQDGDVKSSRYHLNSRRTARAHLSHNAGTRRNLHTLNASFNASFRGSEASSPENHDALSATGHSLNGLNRVLLFVIAVKRGDYSSKAEICQAFGKIMYLLCVIFALTFKILRQVNFILDFEIADPAA